MVREKRRKEESGTGLCRLSKLVGILLFFSNFCRGVNPLRLSGMSVSGRFKRAFVFSVLKFRRSKGGWTAFRVGVGHNWKVRFFPLLQGCASIFSSHRRTSTGYHVACVLNPSKT